MTVTLRYANGTEAVYATADEALAQGVFDELTSSDKALQDVIDQDGNVVAGRTEIDQRKAGA